MSDKVAIVTAAGKGIGAAVARELAEVGYQLSLLSNAGGAVEVAQELGGIGMTGSVTEASDLANLVSATMDAYGRIDAVVNNTGNPPKGELLDIPDADWHLGLDMLLLNVVRMSRLVTPIFIEQGGGAMVNISTFSAFEPELSFPVSSTLRSGLASFTKLYADRYAEAGIRMNNVLPGYMDNYPASAETLAKIPMKRPASVQEIARTVRFLLSADAGYITGQNLRADGGLTHSI
jgi:NAD(P)-dependent dehydrogenase (short-subunit alcohol dehydrogenase family)